MAAGQRKRFFVGQVSMIWIGFGPHGANLSGSPVTLRAFIHVIGATVFVFGLCMDALLIAGSVNGVLRGHASTLGSVMGVAFLVLLGALVGTAIAGIGWHIFRRWDRAVVEQYAEIQALITAIALAETAGFFWPHGPTMILGFLAFLFLRGWLRRLIPHVLGLPREHSRRAVEMAMRLDVSGTPWQDNPSHTR